MVSDNEANTWVYRMTVDRFSEYDDIIKDELSNFEIEMHTDTGIMVLKGSGEFPQEELDNLFQFNYNGLDLKNGNFNQNENGLWSLISDSDNIETINVETPHGGTKPLDEDTLKENDLEYMNYTIDLAIFTLNFNSGIAEIIFDTNKFLIYAENDKVRNKLIQKMKKYRV